MTMRWPSGMEAEKVYKGRTVHEYEVKNMPQEKISDIDLINMLDSGNFGGRVVRYSKERAKVWVYVD